jgi:hypothetical protein
MKHWKNILGICLVFLLGMFAGGLLTAKIVDRRFRAFLQRGPDAVVELIETRLNRELKLDPSQRVGVDKAIQNARAKLKVVREEIKPEVDEAFLGAESDIRLQLRPNQVEKFDEIISRTRARWGK